MIIGSIGKCATGYFLDSTRLNSAVLAALLALGSGASANVQYNPAKPHHTPEGFINNYAAQVTKSPAELLRWSRQAWLIAVGGHEPRWFMKDQHINPAEAVQVHKDLGAKRSVGMHWGTFNLTDESRDQPVRDLAQARLANGLREEDFFMMRIGEARPLPARTAQP